MFRLLKKYYNFSKLERKIFKQFFLWLIYSTILARFIPLRWFGKILGEFRKEGNFELEGGQKEIVSLLYKNNKRCKKILPWKVKCFEEAIAAKKVLEKYKIGSTLFLGVDKKGSDKLIAHAWLKTGEVFITGKGKANQHTVVGYYT